MSEIVLNATFIAGNFTFGSIFQIIWMQYVVFIKLNENFFSNKFYTMILL